MAERTVTVSNKLGLHARAAAKLVHTAGRYQATVEIVHGERQVNAKSILGVMMLAAGKGTVLKLCAEGADAEQALEALENLFGRRFDEE
ncbi:MAG: HPr family phosphocarrier protein [Xanthomonadales bacterium]|nr:HPr family phosphocarrier protein [Xanthomonadales bacterium]